MTNDCTETRGIDPGGRLQGVPALLLEGLLAATYHTRSEWAGERGRDGAEKGTRSVPRNRIRLAHDLADLTHNWPSVINGTNTYHTPQMLAAQVREFLATDYGDPGPHDRHLRDTLGSIAVKLEAGLCGGTLS